MTDGIILTYYPYVGIATMIVGFALVYATSRHRSNYVDLQLTVVLLSIIWPALVTVIIVFAGCLLVGGAMYLVVKALTKALDIVIAKFKKENQS